MADGTTDVYTTCITDPKHVTVRRFDQPLPWWEPVWVRCLPPGLVVSTPVQAPADGPSSLDYHGETDSALGARFSTTGQPNGCYCARPEVQLRAEGSKLWTIAAGSCSAAGARDCLLTGLRPDTSYHGRARIVCEDPSFNSAFFYSEEPGLTLPYCPWLSTSGRLAEFQCANGTYCNMAGPACCNERGGLLKCPESAPKMCAGDRACADGQDYCCAASAAGCESRGGLRPCEPRIRQKADAPRALSVEARGPGEITVSWLPGEQTAGCNWFSWQLEWRRVVWSGASPGGTWVEALECEELANRSETSCNVSGVDGFLEVASPYFHEVRVRETCDDTTTDSAWASTPLFKWRQLGLWDILLFPSQTPRVTTNLLALPHRCVVEAAAPDQFSFCYLGDLGYNGNVTRTDALGGWKNRKLLRCAMEELHEEALGPNNLPAADPDALTLDPTATFFAVSYEAGADIGSCRCAAPEIQIRKDGVAAWTTVGGACADMTLRTCMADNVAVGLTPDTLYHARVRILCDMGSEPQIVPDPSPNGTNMTVTVAVAVGSNYTDATGITLPGCLWSSSSGSLGEVQCADQSYCNATNATCCGTLGGRVRCPPEAPVMCAQADAAGEGSCAAECSALGGLRPCTAAGPVQAPPPTVAAVWSHAPAGLTVNWRPGSYLGGYSTCAFARWRVELALCQGRANCDALAGEWFEPQGCGALTDKAADTSCMPQGLVTQALYLARVTETCSDPILDSATSAAFQAAGHTMPLPGLAPKELVATGIAEGSISLGWAGSAEVDCDFGSWVVQWRNASHPGWETEASCGGGGRGATSCTVAIPGLMQPGNPETYQVRVKEVRPCAVSALDPLADSPWTNGPRFRWERPGEWRIGVGPSASARTEVNVLMAPYKCYVYVEEAASLGVGQGQAYVYGQADGFVYGESSGVAALADYEVGWRSTWPSVNDYSVCPAENATAVFSVVRADNPWAWTSDLWLHCVDEAIGRTTLMDQGSPPAAGSYAPPQGVVAPRPLRVLFTQPEEYVATTAKVTYTLDSPLGACQCAKPTVEVRMDGTDEWLSAGTDCEDLARPYPDQCVLTGLRPNTLYWGRIQLACSDPALNSTWKRGTQITTLPPCLWITESTRLRHLQCHDGTFCDMSSEGCCVGRGGTARCPSLAPKMCRNQAFRARYYTRNHKSEMSFEDSAENIR